MNAEACRPASCITTRWRSRSTTTRSLVFLSNGVLHHTPNTRNVVTEIRRVLKPGGKAIVMMYAESSSHYWRELVGTLGLKRDLLKNHSMGEIMSRYVEISQNDARPLVKVYTAARLKHLFEGFDRRVVTCASSLGASCRRSLRCH